MYKYHFVYKENPQDYYSKGVNVQADTPEEAMEIFFNTHPRTIVFLAMYVVKESIY